jgi:hypothetical protein
VLSEELLILDADSALWQPIRPLLDAALQLEQKDESYCWHGWRKQQIGAFLRQLPARCTLLIGVWETSMDDQREALALGCICEVSAGEVCSVRTFEALSDLPGVQALEPGFEHAFALMKATTAQVAPVAWALFTDRATWNEWLFTEEVNGKTMDKGELLATFATQGRCVLLGNQTRHHHI